MPDNQNTQNNDPNPREGREQDADRKGGAIGMQRRPGDNEPDNLRREREESDEENYAGQSEQPGLPDSKPKEWSPGSGTSS